ncbi:hypothetical protein DERP_009500 [Dermatophagoides pteronyssinus]|uniref:Uncharacterized protein n=1 Tax=Dermatophagoides pteronyssinus TaxID=6956 RepID=A0ABQ8IUB1_DERPT|nr:hypothetical protein DERP_009500 [Dermatophagoides pteronyssinus]
MKKDDDNDNDHQYCNIEINRFQLRLNEKRGCNDTIQISQYISSIHTVYLNGAKFLVNFFFTILRAWIHFENGIVNE